LPRTGKKDKRTGIEEKLNVINWNVRGLNNKENELEEELKKINADVAFISETNKKLKGTKDLHHHILLYSCMPQNRRAASGVAILINSIFTNRIHSYNFVNDRIIKLRIKITRGYLTCVGTSEPEEGKKKEESKEFY
jgi:hypothetical protein